MDKVGSMERISFPVNFPGDGVLVPMLEKFYGPSIYERIPLNSWIKFEAVGRV